MASAGRTLRIPRGLSCLTRTWSRLFNQAPGCLRYHVSTWGKSDGENRMKGRTLSSLMILCLLGGVGFAQKGPATSSHAGGTFEVKVKPLPADEKVEGLTVGRFGIDKQFMGDLEGTSKGEMMTAETSVEGSAGYVAIERVDGTLRGRKGTFVLLHHGTMKRGSDFKLTITVVPDSGTGQLVGLTGTMSIVITDGKHSYEFDYTL
jgi:hypothetical protein